jgi:hypothetical protein
LEERRDIKAVVQLFEQHHVEVLALERIIINKEMDYAGTLDYRLRFPQILLPVIGDLKTGSRLDLAYAGYRAQGAAYAHASHEVNDQGEVVDAPEVDRDIGFLVHLVPGSGEAKFVGMNLLDGWRAFRLGHRVWSHGRGHPRVLSFEEALVTHASITVDREFTRSMWLKRRIETLRTITEDPSEHGMKAIKYLVSVWPDGVPTKADDGWTGDDLNRVAATVQVVETEYEAPFPASDPTRIR